MGCRSARPLVSSELGTLFAFIPPDDEVRQHTELMETYRVAEFVGCVSVRFGFPNDEAQGPWVDRGLTFYGVNEALESGWLEQMRTLDRQHP